MHRLLHALVRLAPQQDRGEQKQQAAAVERVVDEILLRPEHVWFVEGAGDEMERIQQEMQRRYGQGGNTIKGDAS